MQYVETAKPLVKLHGQQKLHPPTASPLGNRSCRCLTSQSLQIVNYAGEDLHLTGSPHLGVAGIANVRQTIAMYASIVLD